MKSHAWNVSVPEATQIQKELRESITLSRLPKPPVTIGGADISFSRYSDIFHAGVVVLSFPELTIIERSFFTMQVSFPYVPGYLSFREVPAIAEAFYKLRTKPDVLMMDGHGIAHPRRLGVATHLGLVLDTPTFGCAKSLLYGVGEQPGLKRGDISYLRDKKDPTEILGAYVRTKDNVSPVIISPGHKTELEESIALTLKSALKQRIPEPTRQAHIAVNQFRKGELV